MPILLLALLGGLAVAYITNGDLGRLEDAPLRFAWLLIPAALLQLVIFPPFMSNRWLGQAVPYLYGASFVAVFAVLAVNWRTRGLALAALGVGLNLAAIVANGGYMPASADAVRRAGMASGYEHVPWVAEGATVHQNSILRADAPLRPLGDVFVIDAGPLSTVFSAGDALLAAGVVWLLLHYSRRPRGRHRLGGRRDDDRSRSDDADGPRHPPAERRIAEKRARGRSGRGRPTPGAAGPGGAALTALAVTGLAPETAS